MNWDHEPFWRQVGATLGAFFILGVLWLGIWAVIELAAAHEARPTLEQRAARRAAMARELGK